MSDTDKTRLKELLNQSLTLRNAIKQTAPTATNYKSMIAELKSKAVEARALSDKLRSRPYLLGAAGEATRWIGRRRRPLHEAARPVLGTLSLVERAVGVPTRPIHSCAQSSALQAGNLPWLAGESSHLWQRPRGGEHRDGGIRRGILHCETHRGPRVLLRGNRTQIICNIPNNVS
ncbi:hypothetical protein PPL_00394 [Heterostelium album PN500]|uniref:Uncharacterized protein n=1 Tax=Heterostelium pallidum (strain ATCC 26659 / Pp 5 / PN500) TaxID=670386 RepID=D3AWC0_HETP5|nr:hypothetical protein PPL_00394 [Heterostelium album PN500]EFA86593.1 hypothetical protein PPL_00394 [Heterostelium album PN500]|eukprot:XP_020438698.1 hypothetical protein PPL_00394 [Heterostelium album PN500]